MDCGSSPLARGTFHCLSRRLHLLRLIPARAGNMRCSTPPPQHSSAHPRSRREHWSNPILPSEAIDSPPLARGTLRGAFSMSKTPRLIPARAGNTRPALTEPFARSAHPRSRGEHKLANAWSVCFMGSSPLARGTPYPLDEHQKNMRLIPARAGNTSSSSAKPSLTSAHPRSRGEHWDMAMLMTQRAGSSPLARGTHTLLLQR